MTGDWSILNIIIVCGMYTAKVVRGMNGRWHRKPASRLVLAPRAVELTRVLRVPRPSRSTGHVDDRIVICIDNCKAWRSIYIVEVVEEVIERLEACAADLPPIYLE
jgi:hypothetical protein